MLLYTSPLGGRREMGQDRSTGSDLGAAREAADKARRLLGAAMDPLEQRKADEAAAALARARALTFKQATERYIETHKAGRKHAKHAKLWASSLETYAYPEAG